MISLDQASARRPATLAAAFAVALIFGAAPARASVVLSDNIANAPSGTTDVSGSYYLASSFSTDSSSYTLDSVSLLLAQGASTSVAEVDIYTDAGLQPGALVATLSAPSSFASGTPAAATFTASGAVSLYADSTYWVVLKATSGDFLWSYTDDATGAGAGFQADWAESLDAGNSWFYHDSEPNQLTVNATPNASGTVPEPGSLALLGLGLGLAASASRLRRRSRAAA